MSKFPGSTPPNYGRDIELVPVALEALKRSHVSEDEKLVIYSDTQRNKDQVDSFFTAGRILGAETCTLITEPQKDPDREPLSQAIKLMKEADTVISVPSWPWIYEPSFHEILDTGTRILSCMSDISTCMKMQPNEKVIQRAKIGHQLLNQGDEISVTTEGGSDFSVNRGDRMAHYQDGLLEDEPGDWDNFPSAGCSFAPLETSAEGTLVIDEGDIILHLNHIVSSPITCTLENGRITNIEGGSDAKLLRDWFEKWDDPNIYTMAHIGFGTDHRAEISAMQLMEWEAYAGGMLIAFGANDSPFLGGDNRASAHIDIEVLSPTFKVEGEDVLKNGEFVHPEFP